jgi:uncharacterized repeat protein (TIGR01451 family)
MKKRAETFLRTKTQKIIVGGIFLALIMVSGFIAWQILGSKIEEARANSISYADGQVSLEKKYVVGGVEYSNITAQAGDTVTVRLKYNNTGNKSALNAAITDSIPNGFSFVLGSGKNCLVDSPSCAAIPNTNFQNGQSGKQILTAPYAGYLGYPTSATSTNLELGRIKYVYGRTCRYWDGGVNTMEEDMFYISKGNYVTCPSESKPLFTTSPNGPLDGFRDSQVDIMSMVNSPDFFSRTCRYRPHSGGLNSEFNPAYISAGSPATCPPGETPPLYTIDPYRGNNFSMLGARNIYARTCRYKYTQALSEGQELISFHYVGLYDYPVCRDEVPDIYQTDPYRDSMVDLWDAARGYGYIEYQMTLANDAQAGLYGSSANLTSTDLSTNVNTLSDNTIVVGGYTCAYLYPNPSQRDISLSDAELRTDQDFTCNYQPRICVQVFQDSNANGLLDISEQRLAGNQIQLLTADGQSVVYTLTSTATGENCFEPLLGNTTYQVKDLNPISIYSTTGGNVVNVTTTGANSTISVGFGYTDGTLSLSTPSEVSFGTIQISNQDTEVCTTLPNIKVRDTRISAPGWSATLTGSDFVAVDDSNIKLPVKDRFKHIPGTITALSGNIEGVNQGTVRTVTSQSDPAQIFYASPNQGKGEYSMDSTICLTVPAYSRAAQYRGVVYYTLV